MELVVDRTIPRPQRAWYWHGSLAKRALDMLVGGVAILLTAPLWVVIAIATVCDSRGPVLFVQERVGEGGRRFACLKFRTMRQGAEAELDRLKELNEADGPVFKMRRDPRVTRVGRLLRRTSLDELPQLINVVRGHMSLVGPRPPLPSEVERYRPSDLVRLSVKPGLTCWWQVSGRSNVSFDQWVAYDRRYVESVSLAVDLKILLKTVWVVLCWRGAY